MDHQSVKDVEAEKLKRRIATIKNKLARKCRKLQVSEALSRSMVASKSFNPVGNMPHTPHSCSSKKDSGCNRILDEFSKSPGQGDLVKDEFYLSKDFPSFGADVKMSEAAIKRNEVLDSEGHQLIKNKILMDIQPKVTRSISRKSSCNKLANLTEEPAENKVSPLINSCNYESRTFFPPFPSQGNLLHTFDFVLPESFTAMKLDVVRRRKPFNTDSVTEHINVNSETDKCNNVKSVEVLPPKPVVHKYPADVSCDSKTTSELPDSGHLCAEKSDLRISRRKRKKEECDHQRHSDPLSTTSVEMEACLHGSSGSPILALYAMETMSEGKVCDAIIVCQKNQISLWIKRLHWSLTQEFETVEMHNFFFLDRKHLMVVAVNPAGAACCVTLGENSEEVEYCRLSVWWTNCILLFGCCSLDSNLLVLACSDKGWIATCRPNLASATLDIICTMEGTSQSVTTFSPVEGLPGALAGLSSGMLYIWNMSSGDLLVAIAVKQNLGIENCLWAVAEEGLLYLAIAFTIENCSTFLLLVVNPVVQFVATAIRQSKQLRRSKSSFQHVANKDYLMASYGSKDVGIWDMQSMELAAVVRNNRQPITTAFCTPVQDHFRALFGFGNGCVHVYKTTVL